MHFEEAVSGVRQTQKVLVLSSEKLGGYPTPPLALSLNHILEILIIKLE